MQHGIAIATGINKLDDNPRTTIAIGEHSPDFAFKGIALWLENYVADLEIIFHAQNFFPPTASLASCLWS